MKQTAVSRETTMRIDTLHYGDGTVPPGNEGLPNVLAKSMSQVDSRHNGCVVIGALLARSCRDSILAAFEMSLCGAIPVRQFLPTDFTKTVQTPPRTRADQREAKAR